MHRDIKIRENKNVASDNSSFSSFMKNILFIVTKICVNIMMIAFILSVIFTFVIVGIDILKN